MEIGHVLVSSSMILDHFFGGNFETVLEPSIFKDYSVDARLPPSSLSLIYHTIIRKFEKTTREKCRKILLSTEIQRTLTFVADLNTCGSWSHFLSGGAMVHDRLGEDERTVHISLRILKTGSGETE